MVTRRTLPPPHQVASRRLSALPLFGQPSAVCLAAEAAARLISFLGYELQITLKTRQRKTATGLTPRAVLEKFAALQMLDVHVPTTDGREIIMPRYTHSETDVQLLLDQLKLHLPTNRHRKSPPQCRARKRPNRVQLKNRVLSSRARNCGLLRAKVGFYTIASALAHHYLSSFA